ncbi:GNAT family N-acetyltransferase [Massilia sp. S19_KUP03_FR1]|uniref:GNAT family N-acetyltransferase n=1 Tax=Massilia sp. S19_KUP03_FR1 TaxID=3025503 RepID=UPI002FCDD760
MTARRPNSACALTGARVALRQLDSGDAADLLALYADPEVMRYWSHAPWTSIDQARSAIAEARADYRTGASLHYAIAHRETGALIGCCALYAFSRQNRSASVGYMLAKAHRGHGYLREALVLLLDHGFDARSLNRVEAEVSLHNTGSCMVLARMGFQVEGCMREHWIVSGIRHDTVAYGLLRADWRCG